MDIDDVLTGGLPGLIKSQVRNAMDVGLRLGEIEGLTVEDLKILKEAHIEEGYKRIENTIDTALNENIPAFKRLCWCHHCEGVLDCGSDHK